MAGMKTALHSFHHTELAAVHQQEGTFVMTQPAAVHHALAQSVVAFAGREEVNWLLRACLV